MTTELSLPRSLGMLEQELLDPLWHRLIVRNDPLQRFGLSLDIIPEQAEPAVHRMIDLSGRDEDEVRRVIIRSNYMRLGQPSYSRGFHPDDTVAAIMATEPCPTFVHGSIPGRQLGKLALTPGRGQKFISRLGDKLSQYSDEELERRGIQTWRPEPREVTYITPEHLHRASPNETGKQIFRVFIAVLFQDQAQIS